MEFTFNIKNANLFCKILMSVHNVPLRLAMQLWAKQITCIGRCDFVQAFVYSGVELQTYGTHVFLNI